MGRHLTIGDVAVGRIVNRRFAINFEKPDFMAVAANYDRPTERPGYRAHCRNGTPQAQRAVAQRGNAAFRAQPES